MLCLTVRCTKCNEAAVINYDENGILKDSGAAIIACKTCDKVLMFLTSVIINPYEYQVILKMPASFFEQAGISYIQDEDFPQIDLSKATILGGKIG